MRKFWITFKITFNHTLIEGDSVIDMPEGRKLNADYLQEAKQAITADLNEQVKLAGGGEPMDHTKLLILSCIELEE